MAIRYFLNRPFTLAHAPKLSQGLKAQISQLQIRHYHKASRFHRAQFFQNEEFFTVGVYVDGGSGHWSIEKISLEHYLFA
jgi:hypothetical protein